MTMKFKEIALPHFNALYNFARTIATTKEDAEDLVQETYFRACKNFDKFDYGTNIKAWMFKILRNLAIDNLRKKDALCAGNNEPYEDEMFSLSASPTHLVNTIDLKNALDRLPEKYRVIVVLRDVEGFSYQEIADILSFPRGTVMSRLYRGRRELFALITGGRQMRTKNNLVMLKK